MCVIPRKVAGGLSAIGVEPGGVLWGSAWARQDPGARGQGSVHACGLWGEAVPLSRNWDKCKRAFRGFLLPGGEGGGRAGASWMGTGVSHIGGPSHLGMYVPQGLWVVTQEVARRQGGRREPGMAQGTLFLAMCPRAVGALLCLPKRPLEGCEHQTRCCFGVMGEDRSLVGS